MKIRKLIEYILLDMEGQDRDVGKLSTQILSQPHQNYN